MFRILLLVLLLQSAGVAGNCPAQTPSGHEILQKVDENIRARNRVVVSIMRIHGRRGTREIKAKSWIRGTEASFTEYLEPPRERGTKMLKLGNRLWTYSPSTDRIITISGHLLRQSVMGSDLSYEDLMEDQALSALYTAEVVGEDSLLGRPCWILALQATVDDIAYHSRKIWVDKERYIPLREQRFARSGKLLKTTEVREVMQTKGRWVARRAVFKDMLRAGDGTEFILESVQFDVEIPPYLFSKAALRR